MHLENNSIKNNGQAIDVKKESMVVSTDGNENYNASLELLEKAQAMIQLEKLLTETLERVEPWLPRNSTNNNHHRNESHHMSNYYHPRVRPIPSDMKEADTILSVARNLASRTSAPAGWNPAAPVVGFSTPAPLPHQLRGGALAALQLERARFAEREKKRQRTIQLQQQEQKQKQQLKQQQKEQMELIDSNHDDTDALNPKRREINQHEQQLDTAHRALQQQRQQQQQQQRSAQAASVIVQKPKLDVSMNLSDDDSSDDDDDSS
jgi:DNA repair exonuclease SbcCD ATPase subunit